MNLKETPDYRVDAEFASKHLPDISRESLLFRTVLPSDIEQLVKIQKQRTPNLDVQKLEQNFLKELTYTHSDDLYFLFVAEFEGKVIGFCRYFDLIDLGDKKKFEAPDGIYCMGILIDPQYRRRGVARFMFEKRLEHIKISQKNVNEVFSMCDAENKPSIDMHLSFGFKEMMYGNGFQHISFFPHQGVLFRLEL